MTSHVVEEGNTPGITSSRTGTTSQSVPGGVRLGWIEKMSVVGACKQTTAGDGGRVGCTRAPETTLLWRVESPGRGAGQRW